MAHKELRFSDPGVAVDITVKRLRDGKIVVKHGEGPVHYTLHPGRHSGTIDLHETQELLPETDPSKHRTLWRRPKAKILEAIQGMGPRLVVELMSLFRPIRLGWIIRRGLAIGPRIPGELEVRKLSLRSGPAEPLPACIKPPEFYEDVLETPFCGYTLYKRERTRDVPYGLMLSCPGPRGKVQLRWASLRDLRRFQARWEPVALSALQS
jgi:hypothetical protein